MKVFVAFLVCIVAALGVEIQMTDHERKMNDMLKDASKACILELNLDKSLINEKGPSMDDNLNKNGCYLACMHKKIGVMKEDGTYSLERMLHLEADQPERKYWAEKVYNKITKETCTSPEITKDHCKMAACFQQAVKDQIMSMQKGNH